MCLYVCACVVRWNRLSDQRREVRCFTRRHAAAERHDWVGAVCTAARSRTSGGQLRVAPGTSTHGRLATCGQQAMHADMSQGPVPAGW